MDMITAVQAAEKWNLSLRTVQNLCKQGKIPGVQRFGGIWMIPADAQRPPDGRSKAEKTEETIVPQPLLRKSPFLNMTDLYNEPGSAEKSIAALSDYPEAQALLAADIAYSQGRIDEVYEHASFFLTNRTGFYAVLSGGMLLALCAIWKGDVHLWNRARQHILEAPCKNEVDRDIVQLTLAAADGVIRNTNQFPEWFIRGCFDNLPRDSHPAARVFYIKYLLIMAQDLAIGKQERDGIAGLGMMRMLPYMMEPMISQMVVDRIIMAEIQLRMLGSIVCHQYGDDERAAGHLDKAIRLCLPDKLYGPLVEYRRQLGPFLDDRLALIDPEVLKQVKAMYKPYNAGWTKLHNLVLDRQVHAALSNQERQVARLAAFGMTDAQIASQLHLSESSVKAAIRNAKNKTGVSSRKELGSFI